MSIKTQAEMIRSNYRRDDQTPQGGSGGPDTGGDNAKGGAPDNGDGASFTHTQVQDAVKEAVRQRNYALRDLMAGAGVLKRDGRLEDVGAVFKGIQTELADAKKLLEANEAKGGGRKGEGTITADEYKTRLESALAEADAARADQIKGLEEKNSKLNNLIQEHVVNGGLREACKDKDVNAIPKAVLSYKNQLNYKLEANEDPNDGPKVLNLDGTPAWDPVKRSAKTLVDVLLELKADPDLGWMFKLTTGGGVTGQAAAAASGSNGAASSSAQNQGTQGGVVKQPSKIALGIKELGWGQRGGLSGGQG